MRALLDVNVLIALLDGGHTYHRLATLWLEREMINGWASCAITQNGCIRIMSQPAYPGSHPAAEVAARLAEAVSETDHVFWAADVSLLDREQFKWTSILGHRQITDAYLLALSVKHQGRFVTFDKRLTLDAVSGATEDHLHILR